MRELRADYCTSSYWDLEELNLDLNKVHDWYVKWDTLNVMKTKDSLEYEEYPGDAGEPDFKRPACLAIDEEEVI